MQPLAHHTDKQLLLLLSAGDRAAFTEIYQRYWKYIYAIAFRYCGDRTAAEEIVQEVFLKVWERRGQLQIDDLSAYLGTAGKFSILHQLQKDYRRKQIRTSLHLATTDETTAQQVEATFLKEYLQGFVERLPEKCRLVYKMSREQHLDNATIAAELNLSSKTVEAHLTRALGTLRGALKDAALPVIRYLISR